MKDKKIKRLDNEVSEGPRGLRENKAKEWLPEINMEISDVTERMTALWSQWRRLMDAWGFKTGKNEKPHARDVHARKARTWTLLGLAAILFELLTAGASALLWVADSLSLLMTLALGVAFSGGPIILAKLITGATDDPDRPRSSKKRFERLAYVCGVAGIALFGAFGLLRWMAVGSLLVASITTLATVAFALAAAAAWELRSIYKRPNNVARKYQGAKRKLARLRVLKGKMEELCGRGGHAPRPSGGDDHPPSPPPESSNGKGSYRQKRLPTGTACVALLALLLGALPLTAAAQSQAASEYCSSKVEEVRAYFDTSGSMHKGALRGVLEAFESPPPANFLCGVERWMIHPWAEAVDLAVLPPVQVELQHPDLDEDCGGEASVLASVSEDCQEKRRKALKKASREAWKKIKSERDSLKLTGTEAPKTCLSSVLGRAAEGGPGTLSVIVTDGVHEACGPWPPKTAPIESAGGQTVLVLLPSRSSSEKKNKDGNALKAMKKRTRQLKEVFPGLVVVPAYKIEDGWKWLGKALPASFATQASADASQP